jgi:23S rRNA (uracil1939-C5)-methyltransferase
MSSVTLRILGLAHGGAFIGVVQDERSPLKGKRAFIREVCPGEVVEAEIIEDKPSFIEAKLSNVLEASPQREEPPCPYFRVCGGCDLQHLNINAQRDAKLKMVEDTLRIQGRLAPAKGVLPAGSELAGFNYRRRITLHLDSSGELGFYRPQSGVVVGIEACMLAVERINRCFSAVRSAARAAAQSVGGIVIEAERDQVFLLLKLRDGVLFGEAGRELQRAFSGIDASISVLEGKTEHTLGPKASIPIAHFVQVNEEANAALIELVSGAVGAAEVTELYAGAGNLSFPLARKGAKVTAVEVDRELVRVGRARAQQAQLSSRVAFVQQSAEKYVRSRRLGPTVVLDPPRAGAKVVVRSFSPREVHSVVYVSCNLPSLVRDLKVLTKTGFRLQEVHVLDMFPETHHVECVATLEA